MCAMTGPFNGGALPAALFKLSLDRQMIHPNKHLAGWQGVLQADAYSGYNDLYLANRAPGPVAARYAGAMHGANSSNWPISRARAIGLEPMAPSMARSARTSLRMTSRRSRRRR